MYNLTVQGAAVQSNKNWSSRMVFLEQISNLLLALRTLVALGGAGTYDVLIRQVKHSHSARVINAADSVVTSQTAASGTIAAPNLYGNSTTQLGGDKGSLAGTLSGYMVFLPSLLVVLVRLLLLKELLS
jgi:hypothetical protein